MAWKFLENIFKEKAPFDGEAPEITLVHAASYGRYDEVADLLASGVKAKGDLPSENLLRYNETPLIGAARNGHLEIIKLLIPHSDPSFQDRDGATALMHAAHGGHVECVRLLSNRSDAAIPDKGGYSPLMRAAHEGHAACVIQLIPVSDANARYRVLSGERSDYARSNGFTALMFAVLNGEIEIVKALLPLSDLSLTNDHGDTAQRLAGRQPMPEIASLIQDYAMSQHEKAAFEGLIQETKKNQTPALAPLI
jgi:ankyrin repeat protein